MLVCLSLYHKAFEHVDEHSWNLYIGHYATDDAKYERYINWVFTIKD